MGSLCGNNELEECRTEVIKNGDIERE